MPLISSTISLEGQAPKGWRRLWQQAQRERDSGSLDAILKKMKRLLSEHERKAIGVAGKGSSAALH
jgi:hypothetical protein